MTNGSFTSFSSTIDETQITQLSTLTTVSEASSLKDRIPDPPTHDPAAVAGTSADVGGADGASATSGSLLTDERSKKKKGIGNRMISSFKKMLPS